MYFNFSHSIYLIFLFIIPVIIFFHFYGLRNLRGNSLKFANFEAIARIKGIDLYSKNIFGLSVNIILVVLLVFSLSGLTLYKEVDSSAYTFVIVMDTSESMSAKDLIPDRLTFAKETAINFINTLPAESYVGVLSFSGESHIENEITKDKISLRDSIRNIQISQVGGTDIYEAITNSGKLMKNEKNKAIILMSDGQINVGKIADAIDYSKENKIIVHTMGFGTITGGETSFGMSKLDEDSLKSLSYNTDGKYFSVDSKQKIEESFKEIIKITKQTGTFELAPYLLIIVLIIFLIKQFLVSINKLIW